MLKSIFIRLRKQPKVVRDQVAMTIAGVFTVVILGLWLFTVPEKFSSDEQSMGIFSDLREDIRESAPDFGKITNELGALATTSEEMVEPVIIPNEYPTTSTSTDTSTTRPIRLATTSSSSATTTEESQ